MSDSATPVHLHGATDRSRARLLFAFGRLQLPSVRLGESVLSRHLERTYAIYASKEGDNASWTGYWSRLHAFDWYLACGCLESSPEAWQRLFALRATAADALLIDALRLRAVRLYPRDLERQETAVAEYWSRLLVCENPAQSPILMRYDGLRPLAPWLIRVFQNWHLSDLRRKFEETGACDDDWSAATGPNDWLWRDAFRDAAREWLATIDEDGQLLIGLRWRYRLSQREAAKLLGMHEGTLSRHTAALRDRYLVYIEERLTQQGWTGSDLRDFILAEMDSLLVDEPLLGVSSLARLIARRGLQIPDVGS
jgi:RNA polymerase sigma factor (sigma-70 family)